MTSIKKEIMELRQQFYVYDAEGNPEFGLPWFTEEQDLERLESFLSSALTRIEEAAYKKGWENAQKQSLSCLCDCHTYSVDKRHCINCDFKLSPQEEKISFEDGLEIVKKIQEKKEQCKCHCHSCAYILDAEACPDGLGNCPHCHPSPEELEEKVTDLSFQLTGMLMRMYTSKKHKETFYVSKISEELQKIIDKELSAQKERIRSIVETMEYEDEHNDYQKGYDNAIENIRKLLEGDSK